MGWTVIQKPSNVKQYIDSLYNWKTSDHTYTVMKSSIKNFKEYYAAVSKTDMNGVVQQVFCIITLLEYSKNQLSYKDMDETCGPCYYNCPSTILSLLSPTDNEYANQWREKCQSILLGNKLAKTVGSTIKLQRVQQFADGFSTDEFKVEKYGKKMVAYRGNNGKLYRLRLTSLVNCQTV